MTGKPVPPYLRMRVLAPGLFLQAVLTFTVYGAIAGDFLRFFSLGVVLGGGMALVTCTLYWVIIRLGHQPPGVRW